jgi:hypothetical protein
VTVLAPEYAHELRNHDSLDHVKAIAKVVDSLIAHHPLTIHDLIDSKCRVSWPGSLPRIRVRRQYCPGRYQLQTNAGPL